MPRVLKRLKNAGYDQGGVTEVCTSSRLASLVSPSLVLTRPFYLQSDEVTAARNQLSSDRAAAAAAPKAKKPKKAAKKRKADAL